jgi:hypothetical protein
MSISPSNSTDQSVPQLTTPTLSVSRAILYATLVVGALDATDGVIFFGLHGQNPIQVLQFIASGVLGAAAFSGGLAAAGVGIIVHFAIAAAVAAIYIFASRRIPVLLSQWQIFGLVYGAGVWAVMNLIVLPHTAVAPRPITTAAVLNGIIGHAMFVGLPSAFFARKVRVA